MDVRDIIDRCQDLESVRSPWLNACEKCYDYVLPTAGDDRNNTKIWDSTAPLAISRFTAALESILTPRGMRWHSLKTGKAELDENPEVKLYLEKVNDILFNVRYASAANFANQLIEAYLSLGLTGVAAVFIDEVPGGGIRYKNIPAFELLIAENSAGVVDTVFRKYELTARQARQEFGEQLPPKIMDDAADPKRQSAKHEFIHAVFPREDCRGEKGNKKFPVASFHIAASDQFVCRESGFRIMPYAVSRFEVKPGEAFGISPSMKVLPDIIKINMMYKAIVKNSQRQNDPPLLAADELDMSTAFSLKSGAINYGALDDQLRPKVQPLQTGGSLNISLDLIMDIRKVINEAFFLNLFQILVETPTKTATEVLERAQEKAELLAPVMGRQQSELLKPIIDRELDILIYNGMIPPQPDVMAQVDPDVTPHYETPMARALDSRDGQAIMQALQAIGALAQFDPAAMEIVDVESTARTVWNSFGAPIKTLHTDKELARRRQARQEAEQVAQQQAQAQQALGGLESISKSAGALGLNAETLQGLVDNGMV